MRLKVKGVLGTVCVVSFALAGCGGGGGGSRSGSHTHVIVPPAKSHTYVIVPPAKSRASGMYVTIVSPVAVPASLLTKNGARIVGRAKGPQKCSFTKKAEAPHGPADLKGKTVTLSLSGTGSFVSLVCSTQPRAHFDPSWLP
jgi:hypothetical protein